MKTALALSILTALFATANASPGVVFTPPVTDPTNTTVWTSGQVETVTWDVSNPPANITNRIGRIQFRFDDITTPLVLADNFDILLGTIQVTAPLVITGSDYSLVLFGDSGNFSPEFTINGL
ncbi:hypothetical protein GYMLUDRAFT_262131 [Collybiopsis luxurians FD-317 M1]|uniref:Uncharacterized protein n=1 Tax=Collybiopsis luxurians FD-317 M1 TaxID=944289 RepID=A0A0D0BV38_9AGAR|nr:hypothetical protein GYMLUDRAFT_262131 [Collybiopsis luxurians FD-317 M1]